MGIEPLAMLPYPSSYDDPSCRLHALRLHYLCHSASRGDDAIGLTGLVVEDDLNRIAFDAADDGAQDTQPGRLRFLLGE